MFLILKLENSSSKPYKLTTGCLKKNTLMFSLNFLSYYLVNLHIQHHFLNPQDLGFSKHPQHLTLDQGKADKIKENHREGRNKKLFTIKLANCKQQSIFSITGPNWIKFDFTRVSMVVIFNSEQLLFSNYV